LFGLSGPKLHDQWVIVPSSLPPAVIAMNSYSGIDITRHDFDGGRAGARADHRLEVRAFVVLRAVGLIDAIIDRPVDGMSAIISPLSAAGPR